MQGQRTITGWFLDPLFRVPLPPFRRSLAAPGRESPKEAVELKIAQKIGNLFGTQGDSRQIVLCKKLACMVELLLERRAFV